MSYGNNQVFIHPFTFFLVEQMTEIKNLQNKSKIYEAQKRLFTLSFWLDPEIKTVLSEEIKQLANWQKNTNDMYTSNVLQMIDKFSTALHIAGYFSLAKYGPTTKNSKVPDLEKNLRIALHKKQEERAINNDGD
jgi:hypothetical protein